MSTLSVWLTVSSLVNKDPANKNHLLYKQIELNWINAPLHDDSDHLALYLDVEPGKLQVSGRDAPQPVSTHKPSAMAGRFLVADQHLPLIDFYNETKTRHLTHRHQLGSNDAEVNFEGERENEKIQLFDQRQLSFGTSASSSNNWHHYQPVQVNPGASSRRLGAAATTRTTEDLYDDLELRGRRSDTPKKTPSIKERETLILQDECLGYCVAYLSQGRILAKNCLRTQANWMHNSQIATRPLTGLAIPGTHNSGTYRRPDRTALQMINKYQVNQDTTVFEQLLMGIRSLDLRVGFSKVKHRPERLWIYHDIFRTDNSLQDVLEQVKLFLESTTSELIIMDFHRFTVGFQNEDMETQLERHAKVLELLFQVLGNYIVPSYLGQNAPIQEYISMNKRLVVGYSQRSQLLGAFQQLLSASDGDENQRPSTHHQAIQFGPQVVVQQQPRDIDADQQDANHPNGSQVLIKPVLRQLAGSHHQDDEQEQEGAEEDQEQTDRWMGTRIYNRLKSLKLINHSFSKRFSEPNDSQDADGSEKRARSRGNIYKSPPRLPSIVQSAAATQLDYLHRSMKVTQSNALTADSPNSKLALLFNHVHHIWPNTDKEEQLRQFLEQSTCRKYFGELHSLMAELTPTVFGAISDKYDGLRSLAHKTNRMVSDLIRSKFLHCVNIVATDFHLGNDIVRLAIYANRLRLHNHRHVELESDKQQCKSFRPLKPLLDLDRNKSGTEATTDQNSSRDSSTYPPDGISDLFSTFFKRIFNL